MGNYEHNKQQQEEVLIGSSPGPDTSRLTLTLYEEQACEDAYGTRYVPLMDGWSVGFKVTPPDGVVQWVYLNPSSSDEGGKPPASPVFAYHDEGDAPHFSGAFNYVVTYQTPAGP